MAEIESNWDMVITSLQDICSANESLTFNDLYSQYTKNVPTDPEEILRIKEEVNDHKSNIGTALRLIDTSHQNLQLIIDSIRKSSAPQSPEIEERRSSAAKGGKGGKGGKARKGQGIQKTRAGRLKYTSKFNPLEPILVGSEVAYKLKNRHMEEWIQCEVMKVIGDGIKFEIRDPEPDENNNPGQTFKANYKEILLIPPVSEVKDLAHYPYGTKVLARYPETTTFYPAVVVGHRQDGSVRLKFEGEEEVNKETEVERRLVLPFPDK